MERRIYLFFKILIYSVLCFSEFIIVIGAPSVHRTQLANLEIRKLRQGEAEQVAQSHTELVLEPGFKPRHLGSRVFTFTTVLGSLPDMSAVCVCVCVCVNTYKTDSVSAQLTYTYPAHLTVTFKMFYGWCMVSRRTLLQWQYINWERKFQAILSDIQRKLFSSNIWVIRKRSRLSKIKHKITLKVKREDKWAHIKSC